MVRSGGEVRANCGPVGVASMASEPAVKGAFVNVAGMSIDGGGGWRRDARNSDSNREARFPKDPL